MREIVTKNTTVLLTHELKTGQDARSNEMPFFICDTVVKLDMVYSGGDFVRTMRVIKMRGSSHVMRPIIFKIGLEGIVAFPDARLPD
jgi:KaiC/GvpD/RAD55 family RecA-like ATPase